MNDRSPGTSGVGRYLDMRDDSATPPGPREGSTHDTGDGQDDRRTSGEPLDDLLTS